MELVGLRDLSGDNIEVLINKEIFKSLY